MKHVSIGEVIVSDILTASMARVCIHIIIVHISNAIARCVHLLSQHWPDS